MNIILFYAFYLVVPALLIFLGVIQTIQFVQQTNRRMALNRKRAEEPALDAIYRAIPKLKMGDPQTASRAFSEIDALSRGTSRADKHPSLNQLLTVLDFARFSFLGEEAGDPAIQDVGGILAAILNDACQAFINRDDVAFIEAEANVIRLYLLGKDFKFVQTKQTESARLNPAFIQNLERFAHLLEEVDSAPEIYKMFQDWMKKETIEISSPLETFVYYYLRICFDRYGVGSQANWVRSKSDVVVERKELIGLTKELRIAADDENIKEISRLLKNDYQSLLQNSMETPKLVISQN